MAGTGTSAPLFYGVRSISNRNLGPNQRSSTPAFRSRPVFMAASGSGNIELSLSVTLDGVSDYVDLKRKEPSVSTILTSFENLRDPYVSFSGHCYQTATCKQKIAEIAHAKGPIVLGDNSIMSPVLSQPLELGADYSFGGKTGNSGGDNIGGEKGNGIFNKGINGGGENGNSNNGGGGNGNGNNGGGGNGNNGKGSGPLHGCHCSSCECKDCMTYQFMEVVFLGLLGFVLPFAKKLYNARGKALLLKLLEALEKKRGLKN